MFFAILTQKFLLALLSTQEMEGFFPYAISPQFYIDFKDWYGIGLKLKHSTNYQNFSFQLAVLLALHRSISYRVGSRLPTSL